MPADTVAIEYARRIINDLREERRPEEPEPSMADIKTAILSNGSPFMLQHAIESAGISKLIDKCLSIEEVRVYKPDPAAYQIATSALKLQSPGEACFFSSNAWDVAGAHTFGFRAFWVNRSNQPEEYGLDQNV